MSKPKKIKRIILFTMLGLVGLCLAAVTLSGASNLRLPSRSPVVDRLSENEKARLTEAGNLRLRLGESIWSGWSQTRVPFLVYNEAYAFVVDLPDSTAGWTFALGRQMGSSWEVVPEDTFNGQCYYRQKLTNPKENPQNFIAQVGDTWSATMQTNEYAKIAFYQGFKEGLPPGIREIAPYRLMWSFLGGLVAGLEHESFHVLQANQAFNHLKSAEAVSHLKDAYPFTDAHLNQMWQGEMDLLVRAVRAPTLSEAKILEKQWTAARQARHS